MASRRYKNRSVRGGQSSRHSASGRGDAPSPDAPQFSQAAYSVAVEEASQARRGSGAYHGRDDRHPVPDASGGTNRNAEYIRRLEARNRAAAAAREAGLSVEQRELLRREKGFHVYMRGANEERVQEQAARASEVGHDSTKMRSRRRKSERGRKQPVSEERHTARRSHTTQAPGGSRSADAPSSGARVSRRSGRSKPVRSLWSKHDAPATSTGAPRGSARGESKWAIKPTLQLATQDGGTKTVRLGHHDVDAKPRTVSAPAGQGIQHATGTPSAPATTDSEDSDYLDEEFDTFDDHDAPPSPAKSVVSVETESPPPAPPSLSASSAGLVRQLQLSAQDSDFRALRQSLEVATGAGATAMLGSRVVHHLPSQSRPSSGSLRPSSRASAGQSERPSPRVVASPNTRKDILRAVQRENEAALRATNTAPCSKPQGSSARRDSPAAVRSPLLDRSPPSRQTSCGSADAAGTSGEAALPRLLGRVAELNPRQQRFLLTMLAELEASSAASGTSVRESLGQVQVWKALEAGLNALAKPGDAVQRPASVRSAAAATQPTPSISTSPIDAHNHEVANVSPVGSCSQQAPVAVHELRTVAVELQIFGSYGGASMVGLTAVEFFDSGGNPVQVKPRDIDITGPRTPPAQSKPYRDLGRLVNGTTRTTNERDMWMTVMPPKSEVQRAGPLRLVFHVRCDTLAEIRVWNYNKSLVMSSLGVRQAAVAVDGTVVWEGTLKRAPGNHLFDHSTSIPLTVSGEPPKPSSPATAGTASQQVSPVATAGAGVAGPSSPSAMIDLPSPQEVTDALAWESKKQSAMDVRGVDSGRGDSPSTAVAAAMRLSPIMGSSPRTARYTADGSGNAGANTASVGGRGGDTVSPRGEGKPLWLRGLGRSASAAPAHPAPNQHGEPSTARPVAGRRARGVASGRVTGESKHRHAASGEAAAVAKPTPAASSEARLPIVPEDQPPSQGGDAVQPSALAGGVSVGHSTDAGGSVYTASMLEPHRPARRRALQESWDSLDLFKRTNLSRLDASMGDDTAANAGGTMSHSGMVAHSTGFGGDSSSDEDTVFADSVASSTLHDVGVSSLSAHESAAAASMADTAPVEVPELPHGRVLKLRILSTWGDPHYVGLAGVDLFDENGCPITFADPRASVVGEPADINVLAEYNGDPRTVDNLVDGVGHTRDDLHVWLAPFTPGQEVAVTFTLDTPATLSLLRVWNYNKSRIHSSRGVRHVVVELDGLVVFRGEIRKAPGCDAPAMDCCEIVLFTTDRTILDSIEAWDTEGGWAERDFTAVVAEGVRRKAERRRPRTPGGTAPQLAVASPESGFDVSAAAAARRLSDMQTGARPVTAAVVPRPKHGSAPSPSALAASRERADKFLSIGALLAVDTVPVARVLEFHIDSTWGDIYYAGLTGLSVLGIEVDPTEAVPVGLGRVCALPLTRDQLFANPSDINTDGHSGDPRTLDKLVDAVNQTCNDHHMWLIPFTVGDKHILRIDLGKPQRVAGVRLWNYNKSAEDVRRGVKVMRLVIDGVPVTEPIPVRKAPGCADFDFGQNVFLQDSAGGDDKDAGVSLRCQLRQDAVPVSFGTRRDVFRRRLDRVNQDFETPLFPSGSLFKFVFESTHGDQYYLGLDAIELFSASGAPVAPHPSQVFANPGSVNDILGQGNAKDVRVPGNLVVAPTRDSCDDSHSWLAPLAHSLCPGAANHVYFVFDTPVTLSLIKVWNYSKRPERGARSVEVWVDGLLVFRGGLPPARSTGAYQAILFSGAADVVEREQPHVAYCGTSEQRVALFNDGVLVPRPGSPQGQRPNPTAVGVAIDLAARPTTSAGTKGNGGVAK